MKIYKIINHVIKHNVFDYNFGLIYAVSRTNHHPEVTFKAIFKYSYMWGKKDQNLRLFSIGDHNFIIHILHYVIYYNYYSKYNGEYKSAAPFFYGYSRAVIDIDNVLSLISVF